jgi:hypothetical protein
MCPARAAAGEHGTAEEPRREGRLSREGRRKGACWPIRVTLAVSLHFVAVGFMSPGARAMPDARRFPAAMRPLNHAEILRRPGTPGGAVPRGLSWRGLRGGRDEGWEEQVVEEMHEEVGYAPLG